MQFLPQDKVVQFAYMNPYELLIATEKAIGDSSLHDTHLSLIDKRNDMKTKEQVGGCAWCCTCQTGPMFVVTEGVVLLVLQVCSTGPV
jgi:hypothetical protein